MTIRNAFRWKDPVDEYAPESAPNHAVLTAINLVEVGESVRGLRALEDLVAAGDIWALVALGTYLHVGVDGHCDAQRAVELLTRAAEAGNGVAANNLSTLYITGMPGLECNHELAAHYFAEARRLGFLQAEAIDERERSGGDR